MIRQKLPVFFLHLIFILNAHASIEYSTIDKEPRVEMLVVEDTETGNTYSGPQDQEVHIQGIRDFNHDGIKDALVSIWNGGTCCAIEYSVVSLIDNQLVSANLEESTQDTIITIETEGDSFYVKATEPDFSRMFSFNGESMVLYKTIDRLASVKEIHGPGGVYIDELPPMKFVFDVDDDGKDETLSCEVWTRWGSLRCELPLPDGTRQSLNNGCERFGALKTMNHGYHEFVCNFDRVITFNGKQWVEKSDPSSKAF